MTLGKDLTVLIIDGGGRGSALVDKYSQSSKVKKILVVPGNDLMPITTQKSVKIFPELKTISIPEIINICQQEKVDLVDVAQDNAVAVGLTDEIQKLQIPCIGPTKLAGQIEWDKSWSRNFMKKYNLPSPNYYVFNSPESGFNFLDQHPNQAWFVKASGLAEGKGVIPASNNIEAKNAINEMSRFGQSGQTYLLEDWLVGEEFSAFAVCDGQHFQILGYAQDHKRVNDGDQGPNTGGMGCVSNPLIIGQNIKTQVETIFQKTVDGLIKENREYQGILYLGGIVVDQKVFLIEFNARWGDPEAQVIIPSIKNDFIDLAQAILNQSIDQFQLDIDQKVRVVVAATSKGYPVNYDAVKGKIIIGLDKLINDATIKIYGAGVKVDNRQYIAHGGRLFYIVGEGKNVIEARSKVYQALSVISIEGNNLQYRTDIGWRDLKRLENH